MRLLLDTIACAGWNSGKNGARWFMRRPICRKSAARWRRSTVRRAFFASAASCRVLAAPQFTRFAARPPGSEDEVVVRVRVVRAPVRLAHLVLAGRVALEERVDGLPDERHLDADLGEVRLRLLRERRERDPVDRELGGVVIVIFGSLIPDAFTSARALARFRLIARSRAAGAR